MTKRIVYRTANDGIEADEKVGLACATKCEDESRTQQQFVEDCDINVLARRFGLTNAPMPLGEFNPGAYGDFSDVPDLRTALERVNDAKHKFMDLPAKLRERFNNQPWQMWEFVNDPENAEEAVRLGLLQRFEPETPEAVAPPETGT